MVIRSFVSRSYGYDSSTDSGVSSSDDETQAQDKEIVKTGISLPKTGHEAGILIYMA